MLLVKAFAAEEGRLQVCSVVSLSVETKAGSDIMLSLLTIPTICVELSNPSGTHVFSGQPWGSSSSA